MMEVSNLKKRFGSVEVLDGVSFSIERGETVAVIGPSGSGKSTMLRCLIGLEHADGGDITIEGEPLMSEGRYIHDRQARRICAGMGMVFQSFNLFPHMTVMQNLICAPVMVMKEPRAAAIERGRAMLAKVGLSDKADERPSALSGGQKQRVAIARALMNRPSLLLFDEPTSSLDPQLTAEVLGVMRELSREKMTMIVVTHEMGFAREAASKILFMYDRRILASGTPKEIFENPAEPVVRDFIGSIL